jgi:AcrR family transcriptional regulator
MAIKRRLLADDRRKQILVSSMKVFAKEGFEGATSRKLAAAAKVSEALLYKYFPTKEAIYKDLASLLGSNKDQLVEAMTAQPPSAAAFVSTFYILARMILLGQPGARKDDSIDRLIGQSLLGDGAFANAFLESMFYPLLPYLSACLDAARKAADVKEGAESAERQCILFHHFVGMIALFSLPKRRVLPYADDQTMLREVLLFAYRGVGFTEPAIRKHVDLKLLDQRFQPIFRGDLHK